MVNIQKKITDHYYRNTTHKDIYSNSQLNFKSSTWENSI